MGTRTALLVNVVVFKWFCIDLLMRNTMVQVFSLQLCIAIQVKIM
jgi:hypothetical protein